MPEIAETPEILEALQRKANSIDEAHALTEARVGNVETKMERLEQAMLALADASNPHSASERALAILRGTTTFTPATVE